MGSKYHNGVTIVPKSKQRKYSGKENITFFSPRLQVSEDWLFLKMEKIGKDIF